MKTSDTPPRWTAAPEIPGAAPHDYPPSAGRFSPTSLEDFACPHKYYRGKIWAPAATAPTNIALHFGSCIHAGVAEFYRTIGSPLPQRKAATMAAAAEAWGTFPHDPREPRNVDSMIYILNRYCDAYYRDLAEFLPGSIEATAWVQMPNGTMLGGQIDRVEVHPNGGLYLVDTKTTSARLTEWYFKQWDNSLQMSLYWYILEQLYGDCTQLTIDAISAAKTTPELFSRRSYFRTREQIAHALNTYLRMTDTIMAGLSLPPEQQPYHFYQQQKECTAYGGCPFLDFCTHGYDTPRAVLRFGDQHNA